MTFKIITDSTADLDEKWAQSHDVEILGLHITLDGVVYETVGDKRLTSEVLLEQMKNGSKPTTSQINVGQFEEAFRRHAESGQAVLYLAFSSVLSGTYQSAVMAREMILEEYPEAVIEIVDTLAAAGGEGYLSILAAQARDEGKNLEETKAMIEDVLPRLRTYFLVDDLYHLMRGGRLSKGSAIIGSLVNIKPLLWLAADGKLLPIAKVRGRKKGMKEMLSLATQDLAHKTAIVAYSTDLDSAQTLKENLLENPMIDEVLIVPLGPVISTHVGPGTLAVFTIGKEAR
ncbi:DegV family protein [Streptococcus minor]|uniref:DegV family protein n=1 Tax=Streptococcus minor TaxID=229549 RepID=A0A3P1VBX5_9STRE|nr:DegV family protein [Streptococcus minor]MDO5078538.1 DegV family protein [Streptococcus minor]RRD31651.1 DegV family protein [Streptococcus minor]